MKIPYGRSDFGEIRARGLFYVDKTPFLPILESDESGYAYLFFLRPRRFGKSTLLSLLEHYYDIDRKDQFDRLFEGLWIHRQPTAERNRYLVLSLDFSPVGTDGGEDLLRENFCESVKGSLRTFLLRYGERIAQLAAMYERLESYRDAAALITNVLGIIAATEYKLYVLIDEYDDFANRLLSSGAQDLYEKSILDRTGFVRTFYAALKSGTGPGAVGRMLVTGVTPLMLNDLSSGFNVATNISLHPRFNTLTGFTRADVERAVAEFLAARPDLAGQPEIVDRSRLLELLEAYYDGYRFSPGASERVFNSNMVLYFLSELHNWGQFPTQMLDQNVRTDYGHLQRIGTAGGMDAAERRTLLETILSEGHIRSDIVPQFGIKSVSLREPYISLLHYLGMLTQGAPDQPAEGTRYRLEIPNHVIRELQWEHLALMLKEQDQVAIDVSDIKAAVEPMAIQGEIRPFLDLFHSRVIKAFSVRDTVRLNEKTIKLLFMTYVSLGRVFYPLSEKEFAQGYCDLFLGASKHLPGLRYSWLLEFKYLKTNATAAEVKKAFTQAERQVERYARDETLRPLLAGGRELKAGMLVFIGTKKVEFRPWPPAPGATPKTAKPKNAKRKAAQARSAARSRAKA